MLTSLLRTIDPTVEPITLDEAKQQSRVTVTDDDAWFPAKIAVARSYVETQTGRALLQQTWRASFSHFPRFHRGVAHDSFYGYGSGYGFACSEFGWIMPGALLLPRPRLIGIGSVQYYDSYGAQHTLDPSQYTVAMDSEPASLQPTVGSWWPATQSGRPDAVQVTYTAGYGSTADAVPGDLQLAQLLLIAHWYENREATVLPTTGTGPVEIPLGVDELLGGYTLPVFTYGGD